MNKFTKTLIAMSLVFAATTAVAADKSHCTAQASVNMWDSTAVSSDVSTTKTHTKVRAVNKTQ